MTSATPPKGRPTSGKIDREAAAKSVHRRNQIIKILWIVVAIVVLGLILYFGSNSGSGPVPTPGQPTN